MEKEGLERLVRNAVLTEFAKQGVYFFPVAISGRHVHLSKNDFEKLFGPGKTMTKARDLSQPGQFSCEETVEVIGPKASIQKVRVLGPERSDTQVEVSVTDCFKLGIKPDIRMSGNIAGTVGCTLAGPAGKITINAGVIVAARHVHLSDDQAASYGVKDGDAISLMTPSPRDGIIGNITVRVSKEFDLEVHLDTDEANGNGILCGTILEAAKGNDFSFWLSKPAGTHESAAACTQTPPAPALELITERDINKALVRGEKTLYCTANGFISPAAADRAKERGITLCRLHG